VKKPAQIAEAQAFLERAMEGRSPTIGMVLGSGLGSLANSFGNRIEVPYETIPHFLRSTAIGHAGKLVIGEFGGRQVIAMQGRFHLYEGYHADDVVFPIYVMKAIGVDGLILTNAAGGINMSFQPGDLVAINDIINFSSRNPLIGPNDESIGPRFPDMSSVLDPEWVCKVKASEKARGKELKQGVYVFCLGPNYESPAEIRAMRGFGADLVGMSTVPEMIAAKHCGFRIFGISCVTNMAAGVLPQPLTHQEVLETANRVKEHFSKLIHTVVELFE